VAGDGEANHLVEAVHVEDGKRLDGLQLCLRATESRDRAVCFITPSRHKPTLSTRAAATSRDVTAA
jgi:hypothetical protein